jgi:hypothetical protein
MRFFLFLFLLSSCTQAPEAPTDDYVLIEFASKLEEDYHKLKPLKESSSRKP